MDIKLVKSGDKILGIEKINNGVIHCMIFPETHWRIGAFIPDIGETLSYIQL